MSGLDVVARALAARAGARASTALAASPVYNPAGLAAWHAALANRDAAPARVVWLGDSITEGQGAASYGARWVDRALARLRLDCPTPGVAGDVGYRAAMKSDNIGVPNPGDPWTAKTGNPAFLGGFGLGGKGAQLGAAGDGLTFAVTATSVHVYYLTSPGAGGLSIQIDGGAATTFATAGGAPGVTARWTSPALAAGSHSVTVTSTGGGPVYVLGLAVFDGDEAAGVQGYEGGQAAATTATFDNGDPRFLWPVFGFIQPQLVAIAFGTNDYAAQMAPPAFKAHLQSIVALVRAQAPACSFALIGYGRPGHLAAQPIGWNEYVRALYDVADADAGGLNGASGVAVIDLSARLPWAATSGAPVDPLGLYTADRVHFAAKGHAAIGEAVGAALAL